jgi:predicted ATPase
MLVYIGYNGSGYSFGVVMQSLFLLNALTGDKYNKPKELSQAPR